MSLVIKSVTIILLAKLRNFPNNDLFKFSMKLNFFKVRRLFRSFVLNNKFPRKLRKSDNF